MNAPCLSTFQIVLPCKCISFFRYPVETNKIVLELAMPPHISRGTAHQQRRICVPSPLWFCKCYECREHPYYNTQTHTVQNGQYITEALFKRHSRRERQRAVAEANYLAEAQLLPTQPQSKPGPQKSPSVGIQDQDGTSSGSEEIISVPRRKRRQRRKLSTPMPQLSTQLHELAESLSVIDSKSFREGFQRCPAVFVHPPQDHTPNIDVSNFELDPYASSNHAFLQYERSLREASDFLRRCSSCPRKLSRIDSFRLTRLQTQVSKEQEDASQLKEDLWQHQRSIAAASQNAGKIVDTGLLFALPQVGFTANPFDLVQQLNTCRFHCTAD
jgi:hypothetical protein